MDGYLPSFQLNTNLTVEQELKIRLFKESVQAMDLEEARTLLLEASRLLMAKDNIIKKLIEQNIR